MQLVYDGPTRSAVELHRNLRRADVEAIVFPQLGRVYVPDEDAEYVENVLRLSAEFATERRSR